MEQSLVVIRPRGLEEAKDLASTLASARTIPQALQKSPADVLAIILSGAELGLAPMQSIRGIVLIQGKPTLSADAMGALAKSRRDVCEYLVLRHSDAQRAVYETKRVGDPSPTTMGFTLEDAARARLTGDNWQKYPAAMLRARALSAICRAVYPDLLLGVYDPDELEAQPPIRESRGGTTVDSRMGPPPPPSPIIGQVVEARATPPIVVEQSGTVDPLTAELAALRAAIEGAKSAQDLAGLTGRLRALPETDRRGLRVAYEARLKAMGAKP